MSRKSQNTKKQPISLRWKWGVLLFIVMTLVSLAILGIHHSYKIKLTKENFYNESENGFYQMVDYFEKLEKPLEDIIQDYEIVTYLDMSDGLIEFYDDEDNLVYENNELHLNLNDYTTEVKKVTIENSDYLALRSDLVADSDGLRLGTLLVLYPLEILEPVLKLQNKLTLRTAIIIVVVVLIVSLLISHWFYKPLYYLINSLDRVEEENLSDIRMRKPRSNDEWSDLSLHVNKLLDRLDQYVTSQKEFVEDVSHELRTPVAVVQGHLNLIKRWGKDDPEILEESMDAAIQEMDRMEILISDMLDLSRADSVDVDYKDEITEVYSTVRQVYNNFTIVHPDFDFYLDIDQDENEVYIKMFRNHFEQVLVILLDNAVKYSSDRKEVHISVSDSLSKIEVAIQDFGVGMSDEDKDKAFDRFYRADKARSREKGGSGLGLSIAKQLVNGYKGDIRVESSLGQGSVFYIEFPIISKNQE